LEVENFDGRRGGLERRFQSRVAQCRRNVALSSFVDLSMHHFDHRRPERRNMGNKQSRDVSLLVLLSSIVRSTRMLTLIGRSSIMGVPAIDTQTAQHLMGGRTVLAGMRASVAVIGLSSSNPRSVIRSAGADSN
jgi:hypothetical protein